MDTNTRLTTSVKAVVAAVAASAILLNPLSASAAVNVEKKIGQFGSPVEWRLECVKWASGNWPWGGGWKTCIGHKYEMLQHEFFVTASGPDLDQAAGQVVQEALGVAVSAAVGVGLLTPKSRADGACRRRSWRSKDGVRRLSGGSWPRARGVSIRRPH